jgi:hypothetical protein
MRDPASTSGDFVARAAALADQAEHLYSRTKLRNEAIATTREAALRTVGEAAAADQSVRATVDAGGMLTNLVLTPAALKLSPADLADQVVMIAQDAAAKARGTVRHLYADLESEGIVRESPLLLPEPQPHAVTRPRHFVDEQDRTASVLRAEDW